MKSTNPRFLTLALAGLLSAASASALATQSMPDATPGAPATPSGAPGLSYDRNGGGQEQAFREGAASRDNRLNSDEYVKAGNYVGDAWITAKVKALLLKDEGVKGLGVNVETRKGTVQLAGWVNSPAQIAQAETIVRRVEGVKGVSNDLQVKR